MNDTDRIQVTVRGLEKVLLPPPKLPADVATQMQQQAEQNFSKLWVPRAALKVGEMIALPDGATVVRVRQVNWYSSVAGHQAGVLAEIHVEKI